MICKAVKRVKPIYIICYDGTVEGYKEIEIFFGKDKVKLIDLVNNKAVIVKTNDGNVSALRGDYIARNNDGSLFVINKDTFNKEFDFYFDEWE